MILNIFLPFLTPMEPILNYISFQLIQSTTQQPYATKPSLSTNLEIPYISGSRFNYALFTTILANSPNSDVIESRLCDTIYH